MQGANVWSLIRELRLHMPHSVRPPQKKECAVSQKQRKLRKWGKDWLCWVQLGVTSPFYGWDTVHSRESQCLVQLHRPSRYQRQEWRCKNLKALMLLPHVIQLDCITCKKEAENREATAEFSTMDVVCDQNTRAAFTGVLKMETQLGEGFRDSRNTFLPKFGHEQGTENGLICIESRKGTQLTLEQHGFDLCGSNYMQYFSIVNITQSPVGWIQERRNIDMKEIWIPSTDCKLYPDFWMQRWSTPLASMLFKDQLYFKRWEDTVVCWWEISNRGSNDRELREGW